MCSEGRNTDTNNLGKLLREDILPSLLGCTGSEPYCWCDYKTYRIMRVLHPIYQTDVVEWMESIDYLRRLNVPYMICSVPVGEDHTSQRYWTY
jgi:hypothetical protein